MADSQVKVIFGADTDDLKAGLDQTRGDVSSWTAGVSSDCNALLNALNTQTEQMVAALKKPGTAAKESAADSKNAFESWADSFKSNGAKIIAQGAAVMGVLAGIGAAFVSAAKDQDEWTRSALQIGRVFGITAQDASVLMVAMDELAAKNLAAGVNIELLERAYIIFQNKLAENSEEVKKWGVTWQGTGMTTFMAAIAKFQALTSSADKAQFASDMFTRRIAVGLLPALQFLTKEGLEKSRTKSEELGRQVGVENVAASQKLAAAELLLHQNEQKLHTHIAAVGIPAWASYKRGLAAIVGIADLAARAVAGLAYWIDRVDSAAKTSHGILYPYLGKKPSLVGYGTEGGTEEELAAEAIMPKKDQPGAAPEKLGAGGGGADKSRMEAWRQELEDIQEEGKLLEKSTAQERAFWQEKLAICQEGSAEYLQVKHRLYELDVTDAKQAVNLQIAAIKQQQASEKENAAQRLADQDRIVSLNLQYYGKDSMNYQNAVLEKKKMQADADKSDRELAEQKLANSLKLAQMDVEAQRQKLSQEKSLGIISAGKELAQLKALKEQELALEKQNFEQRQAIWAQYPKKMQEILQEVAVAEKKNALEIQKSEAQAAQAVADKWKAAMAPIDSAMSTAINGMIQGTQNMKQMLDHILSGILTSYLNLAAKSLQNWIAAEAAKLLSSQATAAQVVAVEAAAIPEADAAQALADIQAIQGSAAQGAAAAYAAMAGIPVVGPEMGAAAAAETYAAIMGFAAMVPAAAGGWDVPRDSLAYVHKQEMILPASLAGGVRDMVAGGGRGGAGGDTHVHFSFGGSMDKSWFKNNRGHIMEAIKSGVRDGRRFK